MVRTVTDFLMNAGLTDLLNLLIAAIFILLGLVSLVARRPTNTNKLVRLAMVPLLLGVVIMVVIYKTSGIGLHLSEEAIAARKQVALTNGMIGAMAAVFFVATGMLGRKRKIGNGR